MCRSVVCGVVGCWQHGVVRALVVFFFFFKQKTAYEMRISDWSSDVCSSDLSDQLVTQNLARIVAVRDRLAAQQVKLVVAIVPAKARVYPEHLRGRKPPQLHEDLYARAEAVLKRDGIAHADLLAPLVDGKADGEIGRAHV